MNQNKHVHCTGKKKKKQEIHYFVRDEMQIEIEMLPHIRYTKCNQP